ncbi:hypothetical protein TNCV_3544251 [Trichonephila clavipes]|nr:hypothetical protein TNCV_3544251 [Trichonephila clavipes]
MPLRRTDVKLTRLRIGHTLASLTGICCLENALLNPNLALAPLNPTLTHSLTQLTQTYAQAARTSIISTASQTDPNLSNIICPPLQCLTPISSKNPLPGTSCSVSTFSTSSSSTQDNLLPSPSSILPTIQSESLLQIPIPTTTTTTSPGNNLNTLVSPLETETRSRTPPAKLNSVSTENLHESVPNESNTLDLSTTLLAPPPRDTIVRQRKGSPCGEGYAAEEPACVVGDGLRNALPKVGPSRRGTWLRMARRRGLLHIEKSSSWLALTVPAARYGVSRCLRLKNPPAVTLGTLEKCGNSWPGGTAMELEGIRVAKKKKWRQQKRIKAFWFGKAFASSAKKILSFLGRRVESSTPPPVSF